MALGKSWGPSTWYLFHCLSLSFRIEKKQKYMQFFRLVRSIIPCELCKTHFVGALNRNGNGINNNCSNREKMFKWLIKLHNNVNRMNNKKTFTPDQVLEIHIKNNKLVINNSKIITFLIEFINYNIGLGGWRRNNAFKLLKVLSFIYPSPKKQLILQRKLARNRNRRQWLKIYVNVLKK